ncbi:DEAD/DEAH box helicase [Azospirillum canadense]|uniref:DEAD/DEAH box helicase n=1 Tax=Azospirillum canadense TaxID=403962 RepID=UPI002225D250|nr:DEAD/DEAH box helicase [Azospirillum canadense]MCW2241271.1 SNF2 family DNA or RNA helicase [Azospirillum canadense]
MTTFLHSVFRKDRLWLWGETTLAGAAPLPRPRGRKAKAPQRDPNPFDAGAGTLGQMVEAIGLGTGIAAGTVTLWLPTERGRPVPSSPILDDAADEAQTGPMSLAAWETAALGLDPRNAVALLTRVLSDASLAPGLFAGADLAYWAAALRFAGALVARGRLLPDLVREDGRAFARWSPTYLGRDAQALARLSQAMPDAARAVGEAGAPPEDPPPAILTAFLAWIADALMRPPLWDEATPASTTMTLAKAASADDAWLAALTGPVAAIKGDAAALAGLEQRLADWRRPIAVMAVSPVRLCFRLEEPERDPDAEEDATAVTVPEGAWTVRYLLQSHEDPSLLVPVPDAWAKGGNGEAARLLKGVSGGGDLREFLLLSFAQAGRLSPAVEASLKRGVPAGFDTDATGAVDFLTQTAPALEQAGFGVLLPAWWAGRGTRTRLANRAKVRAPKMQGGAALSLEDLVTFDWEVALGDQVLSARDLSALARLKTPLVRVRGQWVLLDAAEIKAAAERLKRRGQEMSARDLVRMALGGSGDMTVDGIDVAGWVKDLLDRLTGARPFDELPVPPGVSATLRPYQRRGYSWLAFLRRWGLGACLADDMGLGKTVQTLTLLQREKDASEEEGRARPTTLLVCPTSVVANWKREAARFTPDLAVMVHHGAGRTRTAAALRRDCKAHDLVVTSYALLQRDAEALKAVPWAGVILDEAQNIKNSETKQAKAARALPADYRVALTGTPVENNVGDLWSVMEFLNPGFLGSAAAFKRNYFMPIQTQRDADATARLKALTGPFVLRRLKTDRSIIDDLPEKQEMKVFCTLTKEQASLYAAVVEDSLKAVEEADGIRRKGLVLATLAKLKQVCNHPAQFLGEGADAFGGLDGRSGKLNRLAEMLEEVLSVGERALLFTQFTEMGDLVKAHLQDRFGREVLFLHGGVPKAARDRMVERFQGDDGPPIFLLSLKAGGTGLTLTAANHVFHIDRWWNPAVEDQATDRAFRIGQTRNVQVHKFICAGTLEEKIDEMIESKKAVAEAVIGTGEDWLTELGTDALRDLLALREDAVA